MAASVATASPARASIATTTVPGIDVSQWQGTIRWGKAAASGKVAFAILRADRGDDYTDPTYATNLVGASGHGVVVGAYHRATPSLTKGDAASEARHFVRTARNAAGDVLPALDIEETGGLTKAQLQDWVRTWLKKVTGLLGVRPMIYSSPNFWKVAMGNTTWFADHGYPLWVAHWGVNAPSVPANDWSGHGWTYWQWTSSGSVAGIPAAVDRDRFHGTDLREGRIASLTVTPAAGGAITGARIACGGAATDCSRLANPGDVLTLTATPDAGAVVLGWTGRCAPAGTTPTCDVTALGDVSVSAIFGYPVTVTVDGTGAGVVTSAPPGVDCGATCSAVFAAGTPVTLTATPDSASGFGTWGADCGGSAPDCIVTVNGPIAATARFDAAVQLEQDGAGTGYAWASARDPRALAHAYRWDHRGGASETFAFRGGAVTLYTVSGPAMGKFRVAIDGTMVATLSGYAPGFLAGVAHRFGSLGAGAHTLVVTATGTAAPKARGTRVAVDALRWGGSLLANPKPLSSTWGPVADASASGGTYAASDTTGSAAWLHFHGTGVTLVTIRGPAMGRAELWVDGALVQTIDLYAKTTMEGATRTVSGLSDADHTIRVVVLGTHRAASRGSTVVVDAWIAR